MQRQVGRKLNDGRFSKLVKHLYIFILMSFVAAVTVIAQPVGAKTGSVLIYNLVSSSPADPASENTVLDLKNKNLVTATFVNLFFINGRDGSITSRAYCLPPAGKSNISAYELNPGARGYIIAIAVDGSGTPIKFNYLDGSADIRLASGHADTIDAVKIEALSATPAVAGAITNLNFDDVNYSKVPSRVSVDPVFSPADGNRTLIAINRIGGSLVSGAAPIGGVGLIFNNTTQQNRSFSFSGLGQALLITTINTPRVGGGLGTFIPSGTTAKFEFAGAGISGAFIHLNSVKKGKQLNFGDNVNVVTVAAATLEIPVIAPTCLLN